MHQAATRPNVYPSRQQFTSAHVAMGGVHAPHSRAPNTHYIHMLTLAAPLVIGELVQDPQKRWRWTRIASIAGAIATEALYQRHRAEKDRSWQERVSQADRFRER